MDPILMEDTYRWPSVKRQVYAAVIANLVLLGHGTISGWFSPALDILLSEDTPLVDGEISNEEVSWLGSISSLGSIFGTLIFGLLSWLIGCKRAMIFLALPSVTFWFMVFFGDYLVEIMIARFIYGFTAGGIQSGVIIYVSEISNPDIRGRLGSFTPLSRNIGVLIALIVGATVDYDFIPAFFFYIPILYMIFLYLLPNTPQFHLKRGEFKEAENSLKYYKSYEGKTEEEVLALQLEIERLKCVIKSTKTSDKISLKDFCTTSALNGLIVGAAMAWFLQLTGCFIIINYSTLIFFELNQPLNSQILSIVLGCSQIFGGLLSSLLSDTFGRKVVLIISLLGSAVGLFGLSIFMYCAHIGYDLSNYWCLPMVILAFVIFISNAGINPLSNVCTVENLPPKIRTSGMVLFTLWYNFVAFLGDKYFPILLKIIFLHGCLAIFAVNCCLGILFVIFYMKETKGQSLDFPDNNSEI